MRQFKKIKNKGIVFGLQDFPALEKHKLEKKLKNIL